jgi:hypothetical protein
MLWHFTGTVAGVISLKTEQSEYEFGHPLPYNAEVHLRSSYRPQYAMISQWDNEIVTCSRQDCSKWTLNSVIVMILYYILLRIVLHMCILFIK